MKHECFLNADNIAIAKQLIADQHDYHVINDNYIIVVAWDNTAWVCFDELKSISMNDLRLIQRLI